MKLLLYLLSLSTLIPTIWASDKHDPKEFDFIVVGAGAAGAVLASRLAQAPSRPSVLLIEAGGLNSNASNATAEQRFQDAFSPNSPMNWGYKTEPQTQLNGQIIDYSRGKGLGGSTAINFCGWTVGPSDDYERWAEIVGDQRFGWENVERVLRRVENLNPRIPDGMGDLLGPGDGVHSRSGNLKLTYDSDWVPDIRDIYVAANESGHDIDRDVNDGNPMGMGMGSVTIADGLRWTSATAYLSPPPASLTIMTDTPVARVVFSGKRAVGIQTVAGQLIKAKKEVILSAGAINTPQLLILSGIGPEEEVKRHGIELVRNAKVGRNLQDHAFVPVGIILKKVSATPFDPASQSPSPMGWFKLPSLEYSSEFRSLPADVQAHMRKSNIPAIEFASHTPPVLLSDGPPTLADDEQFFGALAILMNPQSRGTVQLRSSNLSDAPLMDPKFLSHPFDRLAIIQGVRETMRILSAPTYQDRTVRLIGPSINATDEQIWEYIKGNTHSSWHMAGTARMAQNRDEGVVDAKFRVFGVEGLRVVDLSVLPELINAHTQSAAYVLGEIAAEGLAEEYGLGKH